MSWLLQFVAICLVAWFGGRFFARRCSRLPNLRKLGVIIFLVLAAWFIVSWLSRQHADTDRAGWQLAEVWAQTGKWYALLAGALFGLSFAFTLEGRKHARAVVLLCALLLTVSGLRTIPVYIFLGEGRRDDNGYLRQSKALQSTCGGVALANYLERFRQEKRISEKEITKLCRTTAEGSTMANLVSAAVQYGVTNATARRLTWDELVAAPKPVIVSISTVPGMLHATLLLEINDKYALFIDPAYGRWITTPQRLQKILRGKTILLE